jgi:glutamate N-acetyltransferase / amino-acid N-acetyltransferase
MAYQYKKSIFAPETFPVLPIVQGIKISTTCTGLRYKGRDDLVCVRFDTPAVTAATFTTSSMPSAPIDFCRDALKNDGLTSIVVVNAGNANAFTGQAGKLCCDTVADILSTHEGYAKTQVFQASTGVIGQKLNGTLLGQKSLENQSINTLEDAAKAIMTTDTFAKGAGESIIINGKKINIAGIAKGSGMIAPNMGTMLAFIFTDVGINKDILQTIVSDITDTSFNAITVDGDTSTSDSLGVFATGASDVFLETSDDIEQFKQALNRVTTDLALQIVKDGEGLTKFVTITVNGAVSDVSARKIGLSIANSPLVKTALAGQDANWGRVIAAIGKSGEPANRDLTSISMGGVLIASNGEAVIGYDEAPIAAHMKQSEIAIAVSVGVGNGYAVVYTTDLTHDYIDINADYRS